MKAQLSEAALLGAAKSMLNGVTKSDAVGRIGKNKSNGAKDTEEMQVYFSKLKELVPFMPRNRKLSKLEIIQYVIDYICDLQLALEAHPASSPPPPSSSSSTTTTSVSSRPNAVVVVAAAGGSSSSSSPSNNNNRQPLGVIANVTSNLSNTCAAQEAHHEKLPSHLEELNTRPVSC